MQFYQTIISNIVYQALRKAQVALTALKLANRDLKVDIRTLRRSARQQPGAHPADKRKRTTRNLETLSEEERIATCGRKFAVMNEFCVPQAAFMVNRHDGIVSDDPLRWHSEASALEGLIAELYEETPNELHDLLAHHTSFRGTVCSQTYH